MTAEIISIGDELLIGQIVNTNASFIASELNLSGNWVKRITTIADSKSEILLALQKATASVDLVIITGGLGPTNDDITKKTLCEFFDSRLVVHQPTLDHITKMFRSRGPALLESNRDQAKVPHNCRVITNLSGTAPGMWFEKKKVITIALPGVPFEMKRMMTEEVLPELRKLSMSSPLVHRTVLTIGMGESALAERIKQWEYQLPRDIKLAYLPEVGIVKLRLSCYRSMKGNPVENIEFEIEKLKQLIPELIFGYGKDTIQEVTGNLLKTQQKTVSTAESCTGGTVAHLITSVAGCSAYYKGSVVAYDNAVKIKTLGVDENLIAEHGAVSEEVVTAMAAQVKKLLNTDYAIATSGIAGPDGGMDEKPVGTTWIAIATPDKVFAEKFQLIGDDRERNIRRASLFALNILRRELEAGS